MTWSSPEETRQRYQKQMGAELGEAFYNLVGQVAHLHSKWDDYVALFGANERRIELLNKAAPAFFARLDSTLFDDAVLHIARLTDPPTTGKKSNLTIKQVVGLIDHSALKEALAPLLEELDRKTKFCRDWRNRRIAHNDYELATKSSTTPLEPASRLAVREAMEAISGILNEVTAHYCDAEIGFNYEEPAGARDLLYVLWDGVQAEEARRERIKRTGVHLPEDYRPIDI